MPSITACRTANDLSDLAPHGLGVQYPVKAHADRRCPGLLQMAIRIGRNAVEDVYCEGNVPFAMDRATLVREGNDVLLVACGEMVKPAQEAAALLESDGVSAAVLDMYCVKPLDVDGLLRAAAGKRLVITVEEHSPYGGLGSMVSQVIAANDPKRVVNLALPDAPVITGTSKEVFDHYGLNAEGIAATVRKALG